jgi:hypothetical protein
VTGRGERPSGRPEDRLEQLIGAWQAGASDETAGGDELELVEAAGALLRAGGEIPGPARREQNLSRLMSDVDAAKAAPRPKGVRGMVAGWFGRPAARTALASMAAIIIVGGAGLGAAAAGSEPVRDFLRISSSSAISVEFTGVVVDVSGTELRVDAGGDLRVVLVDGETSIRRRGDNVRLDSVAAGMTVEVHGRLLADNRILATRLALEDGADDVLATPPPVVLPTATIEVDPTAPVAQPTLYDDDDRGGDDDDSSGPGSGVDDDGDSDEADSSGPSENSGPGTADDDVAGGHGEDDGGGDDGGEHGGGDDGGEDDGGGDDDRRTDDDDGGSGSGGGGDDGGDDD